MALQANSCDMPSWNRMSYPLEEGRGIVKCAFLAVLTFFNSFSLCAAESTPLTFEHDIRPILKTHCTHCHGEEEKPKGGVDLRLRRLMDKELDDGTQVVVPGKPEASELVRVIREGQMPKKGKKVSPRELAVIELWVAQGAKAATAEPETLAPGPIITDADRDFWSFKAIKRPPPPVVVNTSRARTAIDLFILAKRREKQLDFAPEAEKRTLIRRVTFDLTGLPPTPEQVKAFVADNSPEAYEKIIDRLLGSAAYGEHWARHWLDGVGYADSNGFADADSVRPQAWRYRDYVIRSINEDKPWTQFIQEQLAGDEIAGVTHDDTQAALQDPGRRDQLIATGFLRMAPDGTGDEVPDEKLARNQVIAEQIKVVSSSLLGLTVGCAQCHDHRYDPISHADYYRMRAIFEPAFDCQDWRKPAQRLYSLYTMDERQRSDEIEKRAAAIDAEANKMSRTFLDEIFEKELLKLPESDRAPYRAARAKEVKDRTPEQIALIKKYPSAIALFGLDLYDESLEKKVNGKRAEATKLRGTKPAEGFVMALTERKGKIPETHLFYRGDHEQPKQAVTPGEISVVAGPQIEPFKPEILASGSSGRRLAYARWLTSGNHPLVARVLVNRVWLNHFGRGIVNSPGDFGQLGERPTHPELLDWLAARFMDGGWKLKPLHREMVLSTVYRQSSRHDDSVNLDPDNRFYGRFKVRRLNAEAVRDAMLAASGVLNPASFGPPVGIGRDLAGRILVGHGEVDPFGDPQRVVTIGKEFYRRSIYVQVRRKQPVTVLDTFDAPVMLPNCEARNVTTVAQQSLLMMNDVVSLEMSRAMAVRLRADVPGDARAQIARAWLVMYGREVSDAECVRALAFLAEQTESVRVFHASEKPVKDAPAPDPPLDALASYCQALFSSNRFLYVE